jgi:hypothetical protein
VKHHTHVCLSGFDVIQNMETSQILKIFNSSKEKEIHATYQKSHNFLEKQNIVKEKFN